MNDWLLFKFNISINNIFICNISWKIYNFTVLSFTLTQYFYFEYSCCDILNGLLGVVVDGLGLFYIIPQNNLDYLLILNNKDIILQNNLIPHIVLLPIFAFDQNFKN